MADEGALSNHTYRMSGNRIGVQTLDLNCPFAVIKHALDGIVNT